MYRATGRVPRACYNLTFRSRQQHDKNLDAFIKLPFIDLFAAMRSPNLRERERALRASAIVYRKAEKMARMEKYRRIFAGLRRSNPPLPNVGF